MAPPLIALALLQELRNMQFTKTKEAIHTLKQITQKMQQLFQDTTELFYREYIFNDAPRFLQILEKDKNSDITKSLELVRNNLMTRLQFNYSMTHRHEHTAQSHLFQQLAAQNDITAITPTKRNQPKTR